MMVDLILFSKGEEIIKMKLRSYMLVSELISEFIEIWMGKRLYCFQALRGTIYEEFIDEIDE